MPVRACPGGRRRRTVAPVIEPARHARRVAGRVIVLSLIVAAATACAKDGEALDRTPFAGEQILVAAGVPISGKNYYPQLHAIECRINAENPFTNFTPSPGVITTLHTPGGHGVRVDSHVYSGYRIPPNYDSMVGKLITVAQTREEAIAKMYRALTEYVIEGVKTTIPFHLKLMQNEDFKAGNYTTKFMETWDFKG